MNKIINRAVSFIKTNAGKAVKWTCKRAPELLTGGIILGLGSTVYFTRRAALKEAEIVAENKPATRKEHFKLVAREYIPVAAGVVVTAGCSIGLGKHDKNLQKKLFNTTAAAEALAASAVKTEKKMKELLGEKKVEQIKEEIRKDEVEEAKKVRPASEPIYGNSTGPLWIESLTKHWFRAEWSEIEKAWDRVKMEALRTGATDYSLFLDCFNIPGGALSEVAVVTDSMVQQNDEVMRPKRMPAGYEENGNPMGYVYFDLDWFQLYADCR